MKSYRETMRGLQRAVLLRYLAEADFNASLAARRMGVHRNTVDYLCGRCGLDLKQLRENRAAMEELMNSEDRELTTQEVLVERKAGRAETYCLERLPNGVRCNTRIPVRERICEDCKARKKASAAADGKV